MEITIFNQSRAFEKKAMAFFKKNNIRVVDVFEKDYGHILQLEGDEYDIRNFCNANRKDVSFG